MSPLPVPKLLHRENEGTESIGKSDLMKLSVLKSRPMADNLMKAQGSAARLHAVGNLGAVELLRNQLNDSDLFERHVEHSVITSCHLYLLTIQ
jgi:hypothetical protein